MSASFTHDFLHEPTDSGSRIYDDAFVEAPGSNAAAVRVSLTGNVGGVTRTPAAIRGDWILYP